MRATARGREWTLRTDKPGFAPGFWRGLVPLVAVTLLMWGCAFAALVPERVVQAWLEGR